MKEKIYYKWLSFLTPDYKAYEGYLNQLAQEGYELLSVGTFGRGKFHKTEEQRVRYYVDLVDQNNEKDYIALCEEAGWILLHEVGNVKVFRQGIDEALIPIQTDDEIEQQNTTKTLIKNEIWLLLFAPWWIYMAYQGFVDYNYRDYLKNISLINPILQLVIGVTYGFYGIYLLYYVSQIKRIGLDQMTQHIKGAKIRRGIYYGLALSVLGIVFLSMLGEESWIWLLFLTMMSITGISIWVGARMRKKCETKTSRTILCVVIMLGIFIAFSMMMLGVFARMNRGHEQPLTDRERANILDLSDFNNGQSEGIIEEWLEEGTSFMVPYYYEYLGYSDTADIDMNYYQCRSEKVAQNMLEHMLKEFEEQDRYFDGFEKTERVTFEVDEAYYNEKRKALLLRKAHQIILLDSKKIDVWQKINLEKIKAILE